MLKLQIAAACSSNAGRIRLKNEDNFYFNGKILSTTMEGKPWFDEYASIAFPQLFGVFDGMGGEYGGEKASLTAASIFAKRFMNISKKTQCIDTLMKSYIKEANNEICREIIKNSGRRMGTTLAVLSIEGSIAHAYNIGDSRIYKYRKNNLEQLSSDHTEIQMLVKMNVIKPEEAKTHPLNHKLTQHLGIFEEELMIEPHYIKTPAEPGDKFLICSDGLTDMVSEEFIKNVLASKNSPANCVKKLAEEAIRSGGKDNVTLIVVDLQQQKDSIFSAIRKFMGEEKQ